MTRVLVRIRKRLAAEQGFSLVELLVVLVLLGVVLAAFTGAFSTTITSSARTYARLQNQQSARFALARLRLDIHCASSVAVADNRGTPTRGFTIVLHEQIDPTTGAAACRNLVLGTEPDTGLTSQFVSWCTVRQADNRWRLYRDNIRECTGTQTATFMVDFIVDPDIWIANDLCDSTQVAQTSPGWQQMVGVTMKVNSTPSQASNQYKLTDSIGLRNTQRETAC